MAAPARPIALLAGSLPWLVLCPMNVLKVLMNKRSPIAHKIVYEASERCQAECGIARMWATCFWSLQFFLAAILFSLWASAPKRRLSAVSDVVLLVAAAKLALGALLLHNHVKEVVREPVAAGALYEITCALALVAAVMKEGRRGDGKRA